MAESLENVLEKAVQEFIDARIAGEEPDLDAFVKNYPGLEDQIRERVRNLQEIDGLFASLVNGQDDDFDGTIAGYELAGQTLGDFEILRLIGTGGMGAVFLARQISLDREVALKVISDVGGARSKSLERFKREAKVLAKISHPNIVSIYEVGEQGPYSYFAMEYVQGTSLDKILARIRNAQSGEKANDVMRRCVEVQGNASDEKSTNAEDIKQAEMDADYIVTISKIVVSIAAALEYAHNKGVLHRDVKPSNILIASDGTAKLADFGLAKAEMQQTVTVTGEFFGTAPYVSPEQVRKPETVDRRSDVYSLAATYYECLTLRPPFEGDTVDETLTRIISREAVPPKKYCPRLSADLNTVLLHALEKSPDDRYQTAAKFAEDIQNVLEFKPITAKRPSVVTKTYKALRRNPMKLALVMGVVLLCILGYWLLSYNHQVQNRKAAQGLVDAARSKMTVGNYADAVTLFRKAFAKDKSYVDAYLGAADCQRISGNFDEAIRHCNEAISIDKNSAMTYYQLGSAFLGQKDFKQAKSAFQKSLLLDQNLSLARTGLAVCYSMLGAKNEAVEELRQVLKIDPAHPQRKEILFNLANTLASLRKYDEAIEAYKEILEIDAEHVNAYIGIGNCYALLGNKTEAQNAFEKSANIEPRNLQARAQLAKFHLSSGRPSLAVGTYRSAGETCQRAGKYKESIQFYNSALEIDPNNVVVLMAVGDCYEALKEFDEAILIFKKAVTCASGNLNIAALACLKLGNCLREAGLHADAEKAYREAIDKKPDYYMAYFTLGAHYQARGLYENAIDIYKKANNIDPKRFESYRSLGSCCMSLARYEEAIGYYEKYLSGEPNNPSVLLWTALCYQNLNNHNKSIELLEKAIKIEPNNSMVYSTLGSSYDSVGRYFDALGAYNKALAFDPDNAVTLGCIAMCYENLGLYSEAAKSYEKSLALLPDSAFGSTKLALIYATCKDDKLRDGKKAVKFATKACELTRYKQHFCLSTLAAAYAECGDFEKAVEWQQKAIELADDNTKGAYEKRLEAYKAKKSWRQ